MRRQGDNSGVRALRWNRGSQHFGQKRGERHDHSSSQLVLDTVTAVILGKQLRSISCHPPLFSLSNALMRFVPESSEAPPLRHIFDEHNLREQVTRVAKYLGVIGVLFISAKKC